VGGCRLGRGDKFAVPYGFCAESALSIELVRRTTGIEINWLDWFTGFAPVGIVLLLAVPLLTYWFYPPEINEARSIGVGGA